MGNEKEKTNGRLKVLAIILGVLVIVAILVGIFIGYPIRL